MEYAVSKGITPHRDVKPDNIMITKEGNVKIADFGLVGLWDKTDKPEEIDALLQKSHAGLTFLTTHNNRVVAGSPPWMAPEQFYGVSEMRSDIYSFGVVLFQLVNDGELPFRPAKGDTWAKAHKMYPLPHVPDAGRPFAGILLRCLEKRRDKRFEDFAEMRGELEHIFKKEITKKTGQKPPAAPSVRELKEGDLINKGMSLANLGLIEEGIKQYKEGLKINPRNPAAHYNLGNALTQRGRLREAAAEYRKAISIDPNLTAAHFNLAMALVRPRPM
jgi:serine/threonine protein kinase